MRGRRFILLFLIVSLVLLSLTGCSKLDRIEVYNKSDLVFDNVTIDIKEGYYYNKHEKFTVDENTVAVTIYFSKDNGSEWEDKE